MAMPAVTVGRMLAGRPLWRPNQRELLARKTIFVSDLTGKPIDEKDAATITIRYADARRGIIVLDANADEVSDLASKGRKQARRGRPRSRRHKRSVEAPAVVTPSGRDHAAQLRRAEGLVTATAV